MRSLIAFPFLLLLVLFALSNSETVRFGLWPMDFTIALPLSIAMLAAMGVAFLLGALMLWATGLGARSRARQLERERDLLDAQVRELKGRGVGTVLAPPS